MEQFVSVKQAAERLSVSQEFLKKLVRKGQLQVVRIGRAVRISEHELERLCRGEIGRGTTGEEVKHR